MVNFTYDGHDSQTINPKGFTPAFELGDGTILTETPVILAYIVQLAGKLLSEDGLVRWRALEATTIMATEIHGNFRPFFHDAPQPEKDKARLALDRRFERLPDSLATSRSW